MKTHFEGHEQMFLEEKVLQTLRLHSFNINTWGKKRVKLLVHLEFHDIRNKGLVCPECCMELLTNTINRGDIAVGFPW